MLTGKLMRFSRQVELLLFWKTIKKWVIVVGLFLGLLLFSAPQSPVQLPILTDASFIGILGATIGFFGALYIQRQQAVSETAKSLRDTIYIPIFNDLSEMNAYMQEKSFLPYPLAIIFRKDDKGFRSYIWEEIRQDYRQSFVWPVLAKQLDKHLKLIETIDSVLKKAQTAAIKQSEQQTIVFRTLEGNMYEVVAQRTLSSVIDEVPYTEHTQQDIGRYLFRKLEWNQLSEEEMTKAQQFMQELHRYCTQLHEVKEVKILQDQLEVDTEELVSSIALIIGYINKHFASQRSIL